MKVEGGLKAEAKQVDAIGGRSRAGVVSEKAKSKFVPIEAEGILLLFFILVTVLQVTRDVTQVS